MNDQVIEFIYKIMDSNLPKDTINEIVRWYTLPRNTEIRGLIELPDEELEQKNIGIVKRPSADDIKKKEDPKVKEEEDAMRNLLSKKINNE